MDIDFKTVIPKFDAILARGLSYGLGSREGQMCVEAAICAALDLPHGDDPGCVAPAVRAFKIRLNDAPWSSEKARAKGLRNLGIAQLGSKGVVDDVLFAVRLAEKTIRVLIPKLLRDVAPEDGACMAAAARCEAEGDVNAAFAAFDAARATHAARAAFDADRAARAAVDANVAAYAADVAAYAAHAAANAAANAANAAYAANAAADVADGYLLLVADLALETLRELKSPGCEWV